jgi:salicylate hydroxylase
MTTNFGWAGRAAADRPTRNQPVDESPRIAIVGAGIGGLTLAAALARAGVPSKVFEQTRRLAEVGAGVQLAPNAVRPLRRLGIGPALHEHGVAIDAMEIRGWDGRPIARTPLGLDCEQYYGAPYLTIHRADLQEALRVAAGPGRLRLGRRLAQAQDGANQAKLVFADGSIHRADVVIGADGIRSVVREALVADERVSAGLGVFRGLVPVEDLPSSAREPVVRMWLGPGGHFVCYPVFAGTQLSFAATTRWDGEPRESYSATGDPGDLLGAFAGWRGLIADVIRAVNQVRQWALHDREPLADWSARRLTVLGDAAHPMLPFMAQGANQAVEDAVDLAARLTVATSADVPSVLVRYAAVRGPRTNAIQQASRGNARLLHIADGQLQRERDRGMWRASGLEKLAWLYGYNRWPSLPIRANTRTVAARTHSV